MGSIPSFIVIFALTLLSTDFDFAVAKEENMVFYAHEITRGINSTVATVAGVNGTSSDVSAFGTINVITHFVTEGPEANSKRLGKFQGLQASTNVTGYNFHVIFSIVFESGKYNGSTLEIHGTIRSAESHKEIAVVGGTGQFRYARGYAVVEIIAFSAPNTDYKFNVTFRSY